MSGNESLALISAVPYLVGSEAGGICDPNRPRRDLEWQKRDSLRLPFTSYESDLFSIGRPSRHGVAVRCRTKVTHLVLAEVVDCDESVVAAIARKCDVPSVRGPVRIAVVPPQIGQLVRLGRSRNRCNPQLFARVPHRKLAVRRKLQHAHSPLHRNPFPPVAGGFRCQRPPPRPALCVG